MYLQKTFRSLTLTTAVAALLVTPVLAGSITGTVKYGGSVPKLRPVNMNADPGCAKKHTSPMKSEVLVLGNGNTMGNVFVQVKSGLAGGKSYKAPGPVTLDQDGCRYIPHVMGVMVGQQIKILNSDGLLHNIHALPNVNQQFNQAMPASVTETVKSFSKPEGMFKIKCDVHPWMGAYVAVLEHPFFDVTATDGKFEISDLPPGTYEIEAWHERLKTKTTSVTLSGDETKTVEFSFAPPQR